MMPVLSVRRRAIPFLAVLVSVLLAVAIPTSGAEAATGHSVRGTVYLGASIASQGAVRVDVARADGTAVASSVTDASGIWSVSGLPDGSYTLKATYLGTFGFWDPVVPSIAIDLPAGSGDRTGQDLQLLEAPSIAGRVTVDGVARAGVEVDALPLDDSSPDTAFPGTTAADGTYRIKLPATGEYIIAFVSPDDDHADEVYQDSNPYLGGDPIEVGAQRIGGLDADLGRGGTITGHLSTRGLAADHLEDVDIDLLVLDPDTGSWVDTRDISGVDDAGDFELYGLFPGTYRVQAQYEGEEGSATGDSATLSVAAGGTVRGDVFLSVGPSGPPKGSLDYVTTASGSISVGGWALDPDTHDPIPVHVYVDGQGTVLTADGNRPDIAAAYPGYGSAHGFSATLTGIAPGAHAVCAYGIDQGTSTPSNTQLGCRTVTVPSDRTIGRVDSVRVLPGAIVVSGWALDPVANRPVEAAVLGSVAGGIPSWDARVIADRSRPDIAAAYPGTGDAHGFVVVAHPAPGKRTFDVLVQVPTDPLPTGVTIVVGRGNPKMAYDVPPANPFGSLDGAAQTGPNTVGLSGWALDTDATATLGVHVYVDGRFTTAVTASAPRSDVDGQFPGFSGPHGYSASLTGVAGGTHTVCVYGINQGAGSNALIGCRTVVVTGGSPIGSFDGVRVTGPGTAVAAGWALDPDVAASVAVHFYVDGRFLTALDSADASRGDIAAAYPGWGPSHGYAPQLTGLPGGSHTLCAYAINAPGTAGGNALLGCRAFSMPSGSPFGTLDAAQSTASGSVTVSGWALDRDTADPLTVHVYVDGAFRSAGAADGSRPDVAAAYGIGWGLRHGYGLTVTGLSPGTHQVCTYAINVGAGGNAALGCRTATVG